MTEVVTSSAASSQLNLLAQRQQAFGIYADRGAADTGFVTADIAAGAADTSQDTSSHSQSAFEDQNPVNRHQDETQRPREATPPPATGPSKARVEIKHIDMGLTPSEVVGTPDILQRFDTNGDGRVDLTEAARAGVAREGVFTFAGLGAPSARLEDKQAALSNDSAPAAPVEVAADAAPVVAEVSNRKMFTSAEVNAAPAKKFFNAVAAQGSPTGHVDAPKKFYGQGAEVVVGKFAAETTQKLSEKVAVDDKVAVTDSDGETKLYDKVAQTDADQTSGGEQDAPRQDTPSQRQAAPDEGAPVVRKPTHKVVEAYAPETTATTTVVTA